MRNKKKIIEHEKKFENKEAIERNETLPAMIVAITSSYSFIASGNFAWSSAFRLATSLAFLAKSSWTCSAALLLKRPL